MQTPETRVTHPWLDAVRFVIFALFGAGVGLMALTNVMAYRVLRPPRRIGFLWWHVSGVSVATFGYGLVAVAAVAGRLGGPAFWATPVVLVASIVFAFTQVIIYRIERQRYAEKVARQRAEKAAKRYADKAPEESGGDSH